MEPSDIHFTDWSRIFIGDVPITFYVELAIRTVVIFTILIVAIRAMGKRMAGQLSRNELAAMASLASAIDVPLQSPERGLLLAVAISLVVIFINRVLALLILNPPRLKKHPQVS